MGDQDINDVFKCNPDTENLTNLLQNAQETKEILKEFLIAVKSSAKAIKTDAIGNGHARSWTGRTSISGECTVAATSKHEPTELRKIWVKYGFLTLYEINEQEQTFNAEILIQLKWTDDALDDVRQEDTECYLQQCWTPDVKIFNLVKENVSQQQMFISEEPAMNYQPIVVIRRKIQGVFKMKLQLNDFPFDYQDLPIILYSEHPRDKVVLKEDEHEFSYFNKDHFNHPQEWTIFDHVDIIEGNPNNILPTDFGQSTNVKVTLGKSKHVEMNESSYSYQISGGGVSERNRFVSTMSSFLTARCRVKRKPNFYLNHICLTAAILVCLSFALFLLPKHSEGSARVIGAMVLLLIMFNFRSMSTTWAPVVSYFTFIDKYLYAQTIYLSLVVLIQAIFTFVYDQNWEKISDFADVIVAAPLLFGQIIAHAVLFIRFKIRSRKSAAFIALSEKVYEHKISVILSNATKRRHSTQTEKARKGYARFVINKTIDGVNEGSQIEGDQSVKVVIEKTPADDSPNGVKAMRSCGSHSDRGGSFGETGTKSVRFPSQS